MKHKMIDHVTEENIRAGSIKIERARWLYSLSVVSMTWALLSGCSILTDHQNSHYELLNFEPILGVNELLGDLKIELLHSEIDLDGDSSIDLIITNGSDYSIEFPPGYGARVFAFDGSNEEWVEVPNLVKYVGDGDVLVSKSDDSNNCIAYLTIAPDLSTDHTYEALRIVVVGTISNSTDSESRQVGAFIDIPRDTR